MTSQCSSDKKRVRLQAEAMKNLTQLLLDAAAEGVHIGINSAYRTKSDQDRIWADHCSNKPGTGKCIKTGESAAAIPGTSNHGFGLAVDLANAGGTRINPHKTPKEWKWIQANKYKYGFENIDNTGESHHYNYLGVVGGGNNTSSTMSSRQKTINTTYCGLVNNIVQGGYYNGKTWEVYKLEQKVTADEENTAKQQSCTKTGKTTTGKVDVIFIGGLETLSYNGVLMTQSEQLKLFKASYGANKNVSGFKYSASTSSILAVLKDNPKIPVVMFSAGCAKADSIAADANADKNKIYIIEPWAKNGNAHVSNAVKSGVPANHVYVGPTIERGKGVVTGVSLSNATNHFEALTLIAPSVK